MIKNWKRRQYDTGRVYREKITILKKDPEPDSVFDTDAYSPWKSLRAYLYTWKTDNINKVSFMGNESARLTRVFTVRRSEIAKQIDTTMRLQWRDKVYDIISCEPSDCEALTYEIVCRLFMQALGGENG